MGAGCRLRDIDGATQQQELATVLGFISKTRRRGPDRGRAFPTLELIVRQRQAIARGRFPDRTAILPWLERAYRRDTPAKPANPKETEILLRRR